MAALGILFVALKLTGHIAWSWFWVTSPFWIGAVLALCFMALFAIVAIAGSRVP